MAGWRRTRWSSPPLAWTLSRSAFRLERGPWASNPPNSVPPFPGSNWGFWSRPRSRSNSIPPRWGLLNICCCVSVLFERPAALAFLTIFPRNSNLAYWKYARLGTLFLFPFPASFEFHSRIFSQTNKNVWISGIRSATVTMLYVLSERKRRASSFLLFELQSHCPLAQAW